MKRVFKNSNRNVALTQLNNVLHCISLTGNTIPVCIHFGIRPGFPLEKIEIHDSNYYSMTTHFHPGTISKRIEINETSKQNEEIISVNRDHKHQLLEMPYAGHHLVTTENYLQNLIEGQSVFSFIAIPTVKKSFFVVSEPTNDNVELPSKIRFGYVEKSINDFADIVDHLDEHYNRITWARVREKTANLNHTIGIVKKSYLALFETA